MTKTKHEDGESVVPSPEVEFEAGKPEQDIETVPTVTQVADGFPILEVELDGLHSVLEPCFDKLITRHGLESFDTPWQYIPDFHLGKINLPIYFTRGASRFINIEPKIDYNAMIKGALISEYGDEILRSGIIEAVGLGTERLDMDMLKKHCTKIQPTLEIIQPVMIPLKGDAALALLRMPDLAMRSFYAGLCANLEAPVRPAREYYKPRLGFDKIYDHAKKFSLVEKTMDYLQFWEKWDPNQ